PRTQYSAAGQFGGVTNAALAARDVDRNMNGDDSFVLGTCVRRTERVTHEYTYPDFMKCQPLNFKGIEGVVELTQCSLTWWNSHVITVGPDVAYAMTWEDLKKKMTDKYYPWVKMKKLKFRSTTNANTTNNQRGTRAGQKPTFYKCRAQAHFKKDCIKLKNNNRGTQGGNATASAKVSCKGKARLQRHHGSQVAITPTTLDHYYDIELADGRIIREDCSHSLRK
nr:hypothetical protein [Tanacetum cinerariifolium]